MQLRECGHCGDRIDADEPHECYVIDKIATQENLPQPPPTDFVASRPLLKDDDWKKNHPANEEIDEGDNDV